MRSWLPVLAALVVIAIVLVAMYLAMNGGPQYDVPELGGP